MKYTFPYWGPFVMETKVDQEFVDILLEKGYESREKKLDFRSKLAGVIDNEYYYDDICIHHTYYHIVMLTIISHHAYYHIVMITIIAHHTVMIIVIAHHTY